MSEQVRLVAIGAPMRDRQKVIIPERRDPYRGRISSQSKALLVMTASAVGALANLARRDRRLR